MNVQLNNKKRDIVQLITGIFVIILIVLLSTRFYFRIDLTTEKRFSVSPITKKVLRNVNDIVYIKVYLDGTLNIPFRRMKKSIREMLDEFKIYGKENIEYEFINPFKGKDKKLQNEIINDLYNKGLKPTNIIEDMEEGGASERIIFPGVIINYKNIEIPVNLLQNLPDKSAEENINNSISTLEYNLIEKIKSITNKDNR